MPGGIDQAIQFDKRLGSKQMNAIFRAALPNLFRWFAEINPQVLTVPDEPDDVGVPLESISWPYRPVSCSRNKISLHATPEHPTALFYFSKSTTNPGRPWNERVVRLSMLRLLSVFTCYSLSLLVSVDVIKDVVWRKWSRANQLEPVSVSERKMVGPSGSLATQTTTRRSSRLQVTASHAGNSVSNAIPVPDDSPESDTELVPKELSSACASNNKRRRSTYTTGSLWKYKTLNYLFWFDSIRC